MDKPKGFLLVTMEPPPALEEEFNDWYDMEHVPERKAVPGIETATRFVCVRGWPRYVAFYDLRDVNVIHEPAYQAISGERFTPWSKRILARVRGLYRAFGEQIYPGHMSIGPMVRLSLIRFRNVSPDDEESLVEHTRRMFEQRAGVRQLRVVRNSADGACDCLALIEKITSSDSEDFDVTGYGYLADHIDLVNEYVPHWVRGPIPGLFAS